MGGTLLIYTVATRAILKSSPAAAPGFALPAGVGSLTPWTGSSRHARCWPVRCTATEASGVRKSTTAEFSNPDAFVLTDGSGANRYPRQGRHRDRPAPPTDRGRSDRPC